MRRDFSGALLIARPATPRRLAQGGSHFIRRGGVAFEAIITLDCDLASSHIEDYVPEPTTIVLVTKRN
jgi:hypothetical protein